MMPAAALTRYPGGPRSGCGAKGGDLGDVFCVVCHGDAKEVAESLTAGLGMDGGAGPGGAVALPEEFGVGEAGLLEEGEGGFGAAPEVVEAALPIALVEGEEGGFVFGEDHAHADGADEFGIGEVDEDIADGPAFGAGAIEEAGADAFGGFVEEGGAFGEAFEDGLEVIGHTWHGRIVDRCVASGQWAVADSRSSVASGRWPDPGPGFGAGPDIQRTRTGRVRHTRGMARPVSVEEIRNIPYFSALSDVEAERLAARVPVKQYGMREIIVAEDEPARGFYILRSGKARIYRAATKGREQTLRMVVPGDTFGEVPVFDEGPSPSTVEAMEPSEVLLVPSAAFRAVVAANPAAAAYLLRHFARRLRSFTDLIQQISTQTVQSRLARYLYQLAREEGISTPEGIVVPREITQQDLASLLGSVREVISRSLHLMAEDGIVEVRRSDILIRDIQALERLL